MDGVVVGKGDCNFCLLGGVGVDNDVGWKFDMLCSGKVCTFVKDYSLLGVSGVVSSEVTKKCRVVTELGVCVVT